jgi:hypothetical protein
MSNLFKDKWKRKLGSISKEKAKIRRESSNKDNDNILIHMKKLGYPVSFNVYLGPGTIPDPRIFSNHTNSRCLHSTTFYPNSNPFIQAAFIDPGKTSCAIRIVKYFLGTGLIEYVWFAIHNFGVGLEQAIIGVETELEVIKINLQMCHHIVIESQLMKSQANYRTFQHMISYIEGFVRNNGMRPIIFEVEIPLKTVYIGGPRTEKQYNGVSIKEWSKKKARYELLRRGDYISNAIIESCSDKQEEDLCDTVCYEYAWWGYLRTIKHMFQDVNWLYILL